MRKIIAIVLLALVGVYGTAALQLSESGANEFLNELESLSLQGKSPQYCARLHEDLQVSIRDHTAPGNPREFDGGKAQFCDYISMAAKGMSLLGPETQVTREDFTLTRNWLHPWTATVSYHETRTTRMTRLDVSVNTVGDDRWILVYTFDGMKAKGLVSESRLAD